MTVEKNDQFYEDEIDLKEIFAVLWRRKWLICGVVIVSVILAYGWTIMHSRSYTKSMMQLNFSGIDKHLYPDGTQFETHDIITQDILNAAADAIENVEHRDLYLTNPRSFIFIDPFVPIEVKEKIKAMERAKQTYIYLPSQFYISFVQPRNGVFTHEERKQILLAINKAFEAKFAEDYVNKKLLAVNLTSDLLDKYDYVEVVDIFKAYLDNYNAYVNDMIKNAGLYRSPQSGVSFVDILSSLENIRKMDLYEVESILKVSMETKQKDALIKKYQYRGKILTREMQKKQEEAKIAKALLQDVWKQENFRTSLDVGSSSQSSSQMLVDASVLDKLSGKDYKSVLLQRSLDAEVAANSLKIDENFLNEEIALLTNKKSTDISTDISIAYIVNSLEMIRKDIVALGQKANALSREYLGTRYSGIIKVLVDPVSGTQYDKSPILVMALSFMMSLILGIFMAFMVEYLRSSKEKQEPTEKTNDIAYRKTHIV